MDPEYFVSRGFVQECALEVTSMGRREWTLTNRDLAIVLSLDDGRLACDSFLERATGQEWIARRGTSDEIFVSVARAGALMVLGGASGWDLAGETRTAGDWSSVTLSLASRSLPLTVHRTWAVHRRLPVLRVHAAIENTGEAAVDILRADTFRLRVAPTETDLHLRWLNNYCRGLKPRPSHPVHLRSVGENIVHAIETGPYSPDCAWFTLFPPGGDERGIVGGWEWSGPMSVTFGDQDGPCLIAGGLSPDGMREPLAPGKRFAVPAGWLGFYAGGVDEASHLAQAFAALVSPPAPAWMRRPPLGYCTWANALDTEKDAPGAGGVHPWFPTEENLLSQVAAAANAGFELFILDYGWFPRVGDWHADRDRFPDGLARVRRAVRAAGMKLGLWMGFASADPGSAVIAAHPDWCATWAGAPIPDAFPLRCSAKVWNTRVLCLGHGPVVDWITSEITRVVEELEVDWLKHDFDTVSLCQSRDHTHTPGDGRIAMCEGFYAVLDAVRERFPGLVIDNWESDSALPDYGMIRRHHVHLIGDAYAAFLLRQMFHGASRLFPPRMLHRYLRLEESDTDMRTSLRSAMLGGPLTILSDPRSWNDAQAKVFREEAALYRRARPSFADGTLYVPLGRPTAGGWDAFQFDRDGRGIVFVFRNDAPEATATVPLAGGAAGRRLAVYRLGAEITGAGRDTTARGGRLAVTLPARRSAAVFAYAPVRPEKV
jgi:hypothetical protein